MRLLEREARKRYGASRFRAGVNAGNGLGLYFWLRLGYRPVRPDERFWPPGRGGDIISMIRLAER